MWVNVRPLDQVKVCSGKVGRLTTYGVEESRRDNVPVDEELLVTAESLETEL